MSRPVHTDFPPADPADFTLVLGGPLFQLFRKFHLTGDALELAQRRIVVLAVVAWVPLLLLSLLEGHALGRRLRHLSSSTSRRTSGSWSSFPCW